MDSRVCPVCKLSNVVISSNWSKEESLVECPNCGKYEISDSDLVVYSTKEPNYELSFALYEKSINRKEQIILSSGNIDTIMKGITLPHTYQEKADLIIKYVYSNIPLITRGFNLSGESGIKFNLIDGDSLRAMFNFLKDEEYFVPEVEYASGGGLLILTSKGIKHAETLINPNRDSDKVFVAMSFSEEMHYIYEKVLEPALKECGYHSLRIDKKEFNGEIINEVIEEIKRSAFLIADFTENKPGVYFEAGYATGIRIPIIYSCKRDEIDKIHFDTNHYNYIEWIDEEDLRNKLIKRITDTGLRRK
jgi:hypothetical protein